MLVEPLQLSGLPRLSLASAGKWRGKILAQWHKVAGTNDPIKSTLYPSAVAIKIVRTKMVLRSLWQTLHSGRLDLS